MLGASQAGGPPHHSRRKDGAAVRDDVHWGPHISREMAKRTLLWTILVVLKRVYGHLYRLSSRCNADHDIDVAAIRKAIVDCREFRRLVAEEVVRASSSLCPASVESPRRQAAGARLAGYVKRNPGHFGSEFFHISVEERFNDAVEADNAKRRVHNARPEVVSNPMQRKELSSNLRQRYESQFRYEMRALAEAQSLPHVERVAVIQLCQEADMVLDDTTHFFSDPNTLGDYEQAHQDFLDSRDRQDNCLLQFLKNTIDKIDGYLNRPRVTGIDSYELFAAAQDPLPEPRTEEDVRADMFATGRELAQERKRLAALEQKLAKVERQQNQFQARLVECRAEAMARTRDFAAYCAFAANSELASRRKDLCTVSAQRIGGTLGTLLDKIGRDRLVEDGTLVASVQRAVGVFAVYDVDQGVFVPHTDMVQDDVCFAELFDRYEQHLCDGFECGRVSLDFMRRLSMALLPIGALDLDIPLMETDPNADMRFRIGNFFEGPLYRWAGLTEAREIQEHARTLRDKQRDVAAKCERMRELVALSEEMLESYQVELGLFGGEDSVDTFVLIDFEDAEPPAAAAAG